MRARNASFAGAERLCAVALTRTPLGSTEAHEKTKVEDARGNSPALAAHSFAIRQGPDESTR
jgi:hypothetical protein